MSPETRVVYIAGASRSGSTLLAMLLGALPGFVSIGELRHLWRRGVQLNERCGCGEAFLQCPFWSEVASRAFGGWQNAPTDRMLELQREVDRFRQLPKLAALPLSGGVRRRVREYADVVGTIYGAVSEVSGEPTVVDSSKGPAFAVILTHVPSVDGTVIHLVRDSRAVAHSWSRLRAKPEVDGGDFMALHGSGRAAVDWMRSNLALDAARVGGISSTRLRYEQLVRARTTEVRRLAAALRLSDDDLAPIAGPTVAVGVQHTVAGNPARFSGGDVRLRPDEEWRSAMRPRDRRLVGAVTWPLLAAYGYPLRG